MALKRKRAKKKKRGTMRPLYRIKTRIWKNGRYQTELYGMSTTKRDALSNFKNAAKGHGGYVYIEECKIIKERASTED